MKILIVHRQMAIYGGAEIMIVRLANYLQSVGHEVSIIATDNQHRPEYEGLNIIAPSYKIKWDTWKMDAKSILKILNTMITLRRLVQKHSKNADVVNAHNFPALWASKTKKPIVWMCNELPDIWHVGKLGILGAAIYKLGLMFDRWYIRKRRPHIVVADKIMRQHVLDRYGIEPVIIPYGIEADYFADGIDKRRDNKCFTIIHPAIVSPSKCQLETVRAMNNGDGLLLIGHKVEGYAKIVDSEAQAKGVRLKMTGQVSRDELRRLYYQSHVAVFPGKGQGSWLSPFEALATGCPIIVSPNLTCSSLIAEYELGIVTDDFNEHINRIKYNYGHYKRQAMKARRFVLRHMGFDDYFKKHERLLINAVAYRAN